MKAARAAAAAVNKGMCGGWPMRRASAAGLAFLLWHLPAYAEPKRLALVIGNNTYAGLPALESCRTAVNGLSGALRRAGYEVIEKLNPSNGQMGAAIAEFSEALTRSNDAVAVAYFCGYATALDTRVFLLPASAKLSRDTDVLSQGIVSRLFVNAVARSNARAGLILLDTVGLPGAPTPLPLATMVDPATLGGKGFAAVQTLGSFPAGTTDLAAAAAVGVPGAGNDWRPMVKALRTKLPTSATRQVVVYEPADGGPTPPASLATGAAAAAVLPLGQSARSANDAGALSTADTRRLQLALQRLGYYAGKVDGVVGADTVAAIRRFQHELRSEMTGQLSKDQTERLLKDSR